MNSNRYRFIEKKIENEQDLDIFRSLGHKNTPQIYSIESDEHTQNIFKLTYIGGGIGSIKKLDIRQSR